MDPPVNAKAAAGAGDNAAAAAQDASNDQKRRSSSRSIKRKRFDDEIVEYSLGLPPAQVHRLSGRSRTQSQTYVPVAGAASASPTSTGTAVAAASATADSSSTAVATAAAAAASANSASSSTAAVAAAAAQPAPSAGASSPAAASSSVTLTTVPIAVAATSAAAASTSTATAPTMFNNSSATAGQSASIAGAAQSIASASIKSESNQSVVSAAPAPVAPVPEKRRAPKSASAGAAANNSFLNASAHAASNQHFGPTPNKRTKKSRIGQQVSTKDLGRWKPIDDLALILGVQQTNDLRMVHRGIKFSCKFTVQELQSRWYSLLYEETISRLAVAAMRNLHPELVEAVQAKALYTTQEEELLGTVKSTETPTTETFQELLDKNALVFYSARTAKSLSTHWQLMKQYTLLPDQQSQLLASAGPPPSSSASASSLISGDAGLQLGATNSKATGRQADGKLLTFAEAEEQLNDAELMAESRDETVELELTLADRCNKKEIRMLENELTRWTVLVDSLTGVGFMPEFDNQTLAVLRGRLVRYLMRSREISFGRTTKDQAVDVDLSLEGPAHKASRRQGTIKLRSNGDFFIVNEGKRPLFIDGAPLLQGSKGRLSNNTIIEIAGLRFIFLINNDLINAIRQESAKMNGPLS